MTQIIPLTKIGFFNPGRLTDKEIEQSFIARVPFFDFVFKKIISEKPESIPQHHLIIGQRGMGKTSLLIRIAAELRKPPYRDSFIPLSFPEEQYNVDRLSKFWLNCLDALADALDKYKATELMALDAEISSLSKEKSLDANAIYETFEKWIGKIKRRPVLLVDNLNLIFSKINKEEQHQLRAILMSKSAPILVGASSNPIDETVEYQAPFYDAFQINYLKKLSFQESINILLNLAKITGNPNFANNVYLQKGRVEALYQLTGGTPRTLAILFPLIQNGFSENIQTDLDALLDVITPLYKARFEELSPQLQVVLDAVALHWDPTNIEQLREITLLENAQLSPQLKRLVDVGWLQKLDAYQTKGAAYELSERFFNIWYLMRRSGRRQKKELYCLTKFLESFYGDDLHEIAKGRLGCKTENVNQIALNLAFADAVRDSELSKKLRNESYDAIIRLSRNNVEVLNSFSIPQSVKDKRLDELQVQLQEQFGKQKYDDVKSTLENITKIDKDNKYAWVALGEVYANHLEAYQEAIHAYKKAIEVDDTFTHSWNGIGNVYMILDRLQEAEYAYKQAIKLDKEQNFALPWFGLGNFNVNSGRLDEAEQAYRKAIILDQKFALPWIGLGNVYKDLEMPIEAEQSYRKAIELDKKNELPWIGLGDVYMRLGKIQNAKTAFKKAVELDERNAYSWKALGNLYTKYSGQYEEAEYAYKEAIKVNELDAALWYELGNLYADHLNKYQEAEKAYRKTIELERKIAHPWNGLGNLYMYLGRYQEAEQFYRKAIELDEKITHPWNGLGHLYSNYLNRYQEAEQAYKKAIAIDESYVYSWFGLANLYMDSLNKYQEAEQAYKKAIEIDKESIPDWNKLGNLYQDFLHNYQEAEESYLKAIEIDTYSNYPKYNLVFLWRDKMNKLKEAKSLFDTISKSDDLKDSYLLNEALFAYCDKNIGIAENFLKDALLAIGDTLPSLTADDWYRSAAVIIKLGFADSLLKVFSENGYDTIFRPFYVAIEAIAKKDDLYFNSIAVEVREPAKKIMERIEAYMK